MHFYDFYNSTRDESESAKLLDFHLSRLKSYQKDFRNALSLYCFCRDWAEAAAGIRDWTWIPARDAAMTIYHFGCTLENLVTNLNGIPTVRDLVDHKKRRQAGKRFNKAFPKWQDLRHAIAHDGELYKDPQAQAKNQLTGGLHLGTVSIGGPGTTMMGGRVRMGDKFLFFINGEHVGYSLNLQSVAELASVHHDIINAFEPAVPSDRIALWRSDMLRI
jgi:hypothetical protein